MLIISLLLEMLIVSAHVPLILVLFTMSFVLLSFRRRWQLLLLLLLLLLSVSSDWHHRYPLPFNYHLIVHIPIWILIRLENLLTQPPLPHAEKYGYPQRNKEYSTTGCDACYCSSAKDGFGLGFGPGFGLGIGLEIT